MKALKSLASGIAVLASAGILLCAGPASAQTFEAVHGGVTCMETGRSVAVASRGGYLSVGETFSKTADCSQSDIYVTRVRDDGTQLWGMWYDMGGDEYVTSVKEVFLDPSGNDGFIITGTTENQFSGCSADEGRYDIFLLRINYCGEVLWSKTYGPPESAEVGWDVLEAQQGDASQGTNPGDLVIAGTTTYPNAAWGPRNGYLLRVDGAGGSIIWDGSYDGPQQGDDNLYALYESQNSDIVAVGSSDSYGNGYQGWIIRVDGNNGRFNNFPQNAAAYGGADFEEFRSVCELTRIGDLVVTGTTHSINNNDEVYVVQTGDDPCNFAGDLVFGNFTPNAPSGGYGIRRIPFNGPGYRIGALIVTGYTWNTNGRQEDVFLQVVRPGNQSAGTGPTLNGVMMRYGGNSMDWGWAVEPVDVSTGSRCRSGGFIVAGFTLSQDLIGNDQAQLYLIKTDLDLTDNCTNDKTQVPQQSPGWGPDCALVDPVEIRAECDPAIEQQCLPGACRYCYCRLRTTACDLEPCDLCQTSEDQALYCQGQIFRFCENGLKSLTGAEAESSAGVTALNSVPNPVKRGNSLTLNYTLGTDAVMNVTVTDISGREVHASVITGKTGDGAITIGTRGWAIGTYMVSVKVGNDVTSTRMVVTE